ncbi:MAG: hypothetical protein DWQ02_19000 [Bacteroidetes bacterium]|nr:MAG: hypothetical protein DWQ02_19000 [Bacteroidota bacterium]
MKIFLEEVASGELVEAKIMDGFSGEMPFRNKGWQFAWKELAKVEGAEFYKIVLKETPDIPEGLLMLTLINEELLFMNNLEVAPHNYGSDGKYEHVAGCLIAFACKKSFELGRGSYLGFLSFDSKTELIEFYQKKYGATWAVGQKMFIDPLQGRKLMEKFLNIETGLKK